MLKCLLLLSLLLVRGWGGDGIQSGSEGALKDGRPTSCPFCLVVVVIVVVIVSCSSWRSISCCRSRSVVIVVVVVAANTEIASREVIRSACGGWESLWNVGFPMEIQILIVACA